ncbi:MAG TPA: ABC transporter permease [Bryobacterales bacterium]|nr:ABC transporter permease [Bryobacterales bacterium]
MVVDSIRFALSALWAHKLRAILTGLGMTIGNASVIIVVTVALTGRAFVLRLVEGVGSNLIYAYYEPGGNAGSSQADYINLDDVNAVRRELGDRASAVAGVVKTFDRIFIEGREREIAVLGSNTDYRVVRHLTVPAGRFFDDLELSGRQKVCLLTADLARRLYGSPQNAIGASVKVHDLQFSVIGIFKEGVDTFGQSEISGDSILIPITVMRYFSQNLRVDPLYVAARSSADVEPLTRLVRQILVSRHRPGSLYTVNNLANLLGAARKISSALTLVLLLVSAIALTISGIFIMNIMLVTVTERTHEIGIRMAMGATRRRIRSQFLLEAGAISFIGGIVGILLGLAAPLVARHFLPGADILISPLSIVAALLVSCTVGVVFGMLPASRAARLNPVDALRYE